MINVLLNVWVCKRAKMNLLSLHCKLDVFYFIKNLRVIMGTRRSLSLYVSPCKSSPQIEALAPSASKAKKRTQRRASKEKGSSKIKKAKIIRRPASSNSGLDMVLSSMTLMISPLKPSRNPSLKIKKNLEKVLQVLNPVKKSDSFFRKLRMERAYFQ